MTLPPGKTRTVDSHAAENLELRQQVEELKRKLDTHAGPAGQLWHPSALTIWPIVFVIVAVLVVAFFTGYIPLEKRDALVRSETAELSQALPRAEVLTVTRSSPKNGLQLPGSIQAITEAPILARADGYLAHRMVDIGDRVKAGQALAEIAAPEIDAQVNQIKSALQQAKAALDQALASLEQGKANRDLAKVTADRWSKVVARGGVSKQEYDQYQAQYQAQIAGVEALEKAVAAQRGNVAAAEANAERIEEVQGYRLVKAPFDGVITLRNVDTGALVNAGNTLLFRIAQTGTLRTYVNVPQTNSSSIKPGQQAILSVSNIPGREFKGTVARTANALDPASRTMLVEVQVPNADGALFPGMYAQVELSDAHSAAPILVPGDALIIGADGTRAAVVGPDHIVHFKLVTVGRDYGDRLEILSGLREGDLIIPKPGDAVREGVKVEPVAVAAAAPNRKK